MPVKHKAILGLFFGGILSFLGLFLIISYIVEGWLNRIGEPDQSLLFWYLPFLLFGLISFSTGSRLVFKGYKDYKRTMKSH